MAGDSSYPRYYPKKKRWQRKAPNQGDGAKHIKIYC
jgi:hypothetical protein